MGRVFRARDVKLNRPVAIKVLRTDWAHNPEWLARFEREAQLLATLNHPNIATVHGLDEADGSRYLVMELVPGQTLAQRLARGPLPINEALAVCKQIAAALEAAHERGIIHRDLKPANVMLTPSGTVKILDFGLAQSTEGLTDNSQIAIEPQTNARVIVGTAAYMAPEQARGLPLDRRCDLWALGCIIYAVFTGRPAFNGATSTDILAAVIDRSPDWKALPANLPARVGQLLRRCLQKDPQRRIRDAGDARLEIEDSLAELEEAPPTVPPAPARKRWWLAWAASTLGIAIATFALGRFLSLKPEAIPTEPAAPATAWSGQLLLGGSTQAYTPRRSPDGQWLAFIVIYEHQAQVGVMKLDSGEWWVLTRHRDRGQVNGLCWSLDSSRLYFDRFFETPAGVYSASPLDRNPEGAREVLVVKDAHMPQVAADGSLIVGKLDASGNYRMHRLAANKVLSPIGPAIEGWSPPVRTLHKRNSVLFWGKVVDDQAAASERKFYLLDIDKDEYRPLGEKNLHLDNQSLAVSPRDDFAYAVVLAQDAFQLIRVPLGGSHRPETLLTLTMRVAGLALDDAGQIYLDQVQRPLEVIRFTLEPEGGDPARRASAERIATPAVWRETESIGHPLQLPDGRIVLPSKTAGRDRLLVAVPGKPPVPLLDDSREETAPPATLVGQRQLAFLAGSGPKRRLRLAAIEDDSIELEAVDLGVSGDRLSALAASPDGKTLYYVQSRQVYSVPTDGSAAPTKVVPGDGVAVYPATGELLIQRFEKTGGRLFRLPRPGGKLEEFLVKPGTLRLAPLQIGGTAINRDGCVLVASTTKDSCFWRPAILQPSGELQLIPVTYDGDIYPAAWAKDGKVLGMGYPLRTELWRLTPTASGLAETVGRAGSVAQAALYPSKKKAVDAVPIVRIGVPR